MAAWTTFANIELKIYEIKKADKITCKAPPGSFRLTSHYPLVRCNDSWIKLTVIRVANNYTASGREFLRREIKTLLDVKKLV